MYYNKINRKKELIKNTVIITFILILAIFSTRYIYYAFNDSTNIDYSSESLDITFHEDEGEELNITKVTPLTDAVGLASTGHTLTITNNLTEPVKYKIILVDNADKTLEDDCSEIAIPREEIRISIKKAGEETVVYKLSDLKDGVLIKETSKALAENKYTIRIWVNNESSLPSGSNHHYHGLIQVVENDTMVAVQ